MNHTLNEKSNKNLENVEHKYTNNTLQNKYADLDNNNYNNNLSSNYSSEKSNNPMSYYFPQGSKQINHELNIKASENKKDFNNQTIYNDKLKSVFILIFINFRINSMI